MVLGADNRKRWSKLDILLMQAYQTIQSEKCAQHGGPRWLCESEEQSLRLRIKDSLCEAKKELELEEERRKDSDEKGVVLYPEFYSADGRELVEYRALYYAQKARDAAEDADDIED